MENDAVGVRRKIKGSGGRGGKEGGRGKKKLYGYGRCKEKEGLGVMGEG